MQPIIAESAPLRGRAVVFVLALAMAAFVASVPLRHHGGKYHKHHQLPRLGKCAHASYVYVNR
jgi:hypothetical protein